MAVRTASGVTTVLLKNNSYEEYKKIIINDRIDKEEVSAFTFSSPSFSNAQLPILIIGYKSGLIIAYSQEKLLNMINIDEKASQSYYKQPITQFILTPNEDEILVLFNDSAIMKFNINSKAVNSTFLEKLKKFTAKISFAKTTKVAVKTRNDITQGGFISATNPELSDFYMINNDALKSNPRAFYKFNCRSISDAIVIGNRRFRKSLLRNADSKGDVIFAFVNYNGSLVVLDYEKMKPQFSLKGYFGGYNSLSFSNDCEFLVLGGHDDCVTLVHVENLSVVRLVGHKSFISRAIFQTIPSEWVGDQNKILAQPFVRVIAASMDGSLSFFEIEKRLFEKDENAIAGKESPIFVNLQHLSPPIEMKPLYIRQVGEAVGWVEICDDLMVASTMDGSIVTYQIQTPQGVVNGITAHNKEKGEEEEVKQNISNHIDHELPNLSDKLARLSSEQELLASVSERGLYETNFDETLAKRFETKSHLMRNNLKSIGSTKKSEEIKASNEPQGNHL